MLFSNRVLSSFAVSRINSFASSTLLASGLMFLLAIFFETAEVTNLKMQQINVVTIVGIEIQPNISNHFVEIKSLISAIFVALSNKKIIFRLRFLN